MFLETIPPLLRGIALALIPYLVCSIAMEKMRRYYVVPLLAYLGYLFFLLPPIGVTGAFGPAHVALPYVGWAFVIFPAILIGKCVIIAVRNESQRRRRAVEEPGQPGPE